MMWRWCTDLLVHIRINEVVGEKKRSHNSKTDHKNKFDSELIDFVLFSSSI